MFYKYAYLELSEAVESTMRASNTVPLIIYRIKQQNLLQWTTELQNDKPLIYYIYR